MTPTRLESVRDYLWVPVPILAFPAVALYVALVAFGLVFGYKIEETCLAAGTLSGAPFSHLRVSLVPLDHVCVYADGATSGSIPGSVNAAIFGALAAAALCAVSAVLLSRHLDRRNPADV